MWYFMSENVQVFVEKLLVRKSLFFRLYDNIHNFYFILCVRYEFYIDIHEFNQLQLFFIFTKIVIYCE